MWLWTGSKTTKRGAEPSVAEYLRRSSRRTEGRCSGTNPEATGTRYLPFFRWRVYRAREASQGSALRSDRYAEQRTRS